MNSGAIVTPAVLAEVAALRVALWENGWRPLAVRTAGKVPAGMAWPARARLTPPACVGEAVDGAFLNTGVLCDGLQAVDLDLDLPGVADQVAAIARSILGETLCRTRQNSSRCLLLYRAAVGSPGKRSLIGTQGKIEVLGAGQQFVAAGTHPSGADLEWSPVSPDLCPLTSLPAVTEEAIGAFLAAAGPLIGAASLAPPPPLTTPGGAERTLADLAPPSAAAVAALFAGLPHGANVPRDTYVAVMLAAAGCMNALRAAGIDDAGEIADAAILWAAKWVGHGDPAVGLAVESDKWDDDFATKSAPKAGWSALQRHAREIDPSYPARLAFGSIDLPPAPPPPIATGANLEDQLLPVGSQIALAERLAKEHEGLLRYVPQTNKWFKWDGMAFRHDRVTAIYDLARRLCRSASVETRDKGLQAKLASASTINAVQAIARSLPGIACVPESLDADIWLLNSLGGVIDLRSGEIGPHDPALNMTKLTGAAPGGECPQWHAFLDVVTAGDKAKQAFLKEVVGYLLTGSTREHAMFFAWGPGGNGKGVFLSTVAFVLGDYAKTAPMETFTMSHGDRHPTELAMLQGARLVTAQETEAGKAWAEAKIKALTGGDPITAHFMRQDDFTYKPQFKLLFAGNHRPEIRSVDEAMRRRLHLIPFTVQIPPEQRDTDLPEKLKAEAGGILAWAIEGCLQWQRRGRLEPPPAVLQATADYLATEDSKSTWVAECCDVGADKMAPAASLFTSWSTWAGRSGEVAGTRRALTQWLEGQGYRRARFGKQRDRGFEGISVRTATVEDFFGADIDGAGLIGKPPALN